jgi:adenylate kinase family enzyme
MKILISESQLIRLTEKYLDQDEMFDDDYLNVLYKETRKKNNSAIKLLALRSSLTDQKLLIQVIH